MPHITEKLVPLTGGIVRRSLSRAGFLPRRSDPLAGLGAPGLGPRSSSLLFLEFLRHRLEQPILVAFERRSDTPPHFRGRPPESVDDLTQRRLVDVQHLGEPVLPDSTHPEL